MFTSNTKSCDYFFGKGPIKYLGNGIFVDANLDHTINTCLICLVSSHLHTICLRLKMVKNFTVETIFKDN